MYQPQKSITSLVKHCYDCVCVSLYLLHIEYQNTHFPAKVRMFLQSGPIWFGPQNFKQLLKGKDVVPRLRLELGGMRLGNVKCLTRVEI